MNNLKCLFEISQMYYMFGKHVWGSICITKHICERAMFHLTENTDDMK